MSPDLQQRMDEATARYDKSVAKIQRQFYFRIALVTVIAPVVLFALLVLYGLLFKIARELWPWMMP